MNAFAVPLNFLQNNMLIHLNIQFSTQTDGFEGKATDTTTKNQKQLWLKVPTPKI